MSDAGARREDKRESTVSEFGEASRHELPASQPIGVAVASQGRVTTSRS